LIWSIDNLLNDLNNISIPSESEFRDAIPKIISNIESNEEKLRETMSEETGMTTLASQKEIERTITSIETCLRIKCAPTEIVESDIPGSRLEIHHVPLGVIGIITPFNHPLNIPVQAILPALAVGNRVLWKAAHQCPKSSQLLTDLIRREGLPLIYGGSSVEVGQAIVESEIDGIVFVGGAAAGKDVAARCGIKKLVLELGGSDALLVLEDLRSDEKRLSNAIDIAIQGRFANSGQRCTSTKRILVEETISQQFVEPFVEKVKALPFGERKDALVGPLVSEESAIFIEKMFQDALAKGAVALVGGKREGRLVHPTVLVGVTPEMMIAREECFGPVASIMTFSGNDEAVRLTNDSTFGLTAAIMTGDRQRALELSGRLRCGGVIINGPTGLRAEWMPFGGFKESGYGRMGAVYLARELTTIKTILEC